jgi:hypothetical protein
MPIRWSATPEPAPLQFIVDKTRVAFFDPSKATIESRVDVYPGESQRLDVAVKLDDEAECYGWSNLNYFSNPVWRHPDWRLSPGRYLVNVTIVSSGESANALFRLIADVPRKDFRLEPAQPRDTVFP